MTINLSDDEFDTLLILLGFAAGWAWKADNRSLAYMALDLSNRVNRDNPNWKPYKLPAQNEDMSDKDLHQALRREWCAD